MKCTFFVWCVLLASGCTVGMEEIVIIKTKKEEKTVIRNVVLAQQVANFAKKERKKYILEPRVIASVIKTKLLSDLTEVSPEQYAIIVAIQKQQPKKYNSLQKQIYGLFRNTQQTKTLQEVRAKLYEYDLRVFANLYEELEVMENDIEVYKTYNDIGTPTGWCFCWVLEFIVASAVTAIALTTCS